VVAGLSVVAPHAEGCVAMTQYVRPDGRKRRVYALRDHGMTLKLSRMRRMRGVWLDVEVLTTGEVSITAECYGNGDRCEVNTLSHEIVPNSESAVLGAVDAVISNAFVRLSAAGGAL
jgi:hypothetical protein